MNKKHTWFVPIGLALMLSLSIFLNSEAQKPKKNTPQPPPDSLEMAREVEENSAEYLFGEAMQYFLSDNYSKALKTLEESRKLAPNNSAIPYQMARAYLKMEDYKNAARCVQQALTLANSNPYYLSLLAEIYEKQDRYDEAEKIYTRLITLKPNEINYYYDLANAMLYQNKFKEAIRVYDELEKKVGLDPSVIQRKQKLYLAMNQQENALKEGKKLIEAAPEDPETYLAQIELLINMRKHDEARKLIAEAENIFPSEPRILLLSAEVAKNTGKKETQLKTLEKAFENPQLAIEQRLQILSDLYEQAIATKDAQIKTALLSLSEKTMQLYPEHPQMQGLYADILLESGKPAEAKGYYQSVLQLHNDNYQAWVGLIRTDLMLQHYRDLAKHTEQAIEYYPNNATFWFYNGTAHLLNRDYDEAVTALEQSRLLAFGNKELLQNIYSQLGDAYNGQKQYDKSDKAYEEALTYDANNRYVLNNYSYYLALRRENLDKAKEMSARLVKLEPENATYLDTYGWVLYMRGEYQEALPLLEKAAKLNPTNGTILEHYGDVLYKTGKSEEAFKYWHLAKKNGAASQWLDRKIAEKKLFE
ncbi:MAG: tetratricopeptide repeat protein [Cytophagales bacterium]|nr:tetratricopeptide repeat protein [Bernardetiaceae bacterium]MDW8204613.1 tetratricopeptide repeat protein [Cytophagales bacterium]